MPLPPALAARLAKRGLIPKVQAAPKQGKNFGSEARHSQSKIFDLRFYFNAKVLKHNLNF